MNRSTICGLAFILSATPWGADAWSAERAAQFPTRPVRLLVPFAPGSQTDILARWIGEKLVEKSGQQVVTDNRPSAGGTIASQYVLEANPDGHTLMMVSTGHAGNATMYSKLSYDTIRDFSGITRVASVPNLLVVSPSLGPKTVKDLIAYAKSRQGQKIGRASCRERVENAEERG